MCKRTSHNRAQGLESWHRTFDYIWKEFVHSLAKVLKSWVFSGFSASYTHRESWRGGLGLIVILRIRDSYRYWDSYRSMGQGVPKFPLEPYGYAIPSICKTYGQSTATTTIPIPRELRQQFDQLWFSLSHLPWNKKEKKLSLKSLNIERAYNQVEAEQLGHLKLKIQHHFYWSAIVFSPLMNFMSYEYPRSRWVNNISKGWFPLRNTFLTTGADRKVSFVLEPLVPSESSQDKGNFPVRSRPEENYPQWKPALRVCIRLQNVMNSLRNESCLLGSTSTQTLESF